MDQPEWTTWPDEPPKDALPKDPLHESLMRNALSRKLSVQKGRDVALQEGREEPDIRLVELGMANVEATLAIYYLLREKLGE